MQEINIQPIRSSMQLGTWIRLAVSAGLIAWIVITLDWREVAAIVRETDMYYLTLSVLLTPVMVMTGVMKWRILLRARDIPVQLSTCFAVYMIGIFFNNFLPTNFGGDAVRAFLMGKTTGRFAVVTASVFTERFLGFTIFILMIPLAVILSPKGLWSLPIQICVTVVALAYLGLLWVVLDRRFHRILARREHIGVFRKLLRFQEAVSAYRGNGRAILACLVLSTLFYLLAVCNVYVTLLAFNVELSFVSVFVATAVVLVVALLPIAINGMGLAEWAYLFALSQFGVSPAAAISVALLIRMKMLTWSLLGGAIYGSGYRATVLNPEPIVPHAAVQKGGHA